MLRTFSIAAALVAAIFSGSSAAQERPRFPRNDEVAACAAVYRIMRTEPGSNSKHQRLGEKADALQRWLDEQMKDLGSLTRDASEYMIRTGAAALELYKVYANLGRPEAVEQDCDKRFADPIMSWLTSVDAGPRSSAGSNTRP